MAHIRKRYLFKKVTLSETLLGVVRREDNHLRNGKQRHHEKYGDKAALKVEKVLDRGPIDQERILLQLFLLFLNSLTALPRVWSTLTQ